MEGYDYTSYENLSPINRFVFDVRRKRIEHYKDDEKDLKSFINHEKQTRDDYSGRELLELLQNAVDASDEGGRIVVELNGDIFRVCNDGIPFSEEGVDSIIRPNLSPKNEYENLGNKGLGLRALLNSSEYIRVYSDGLSIQMGLNDATLCKELTDLKYRPPILSVPRIIEKKENYDYVTVVECKIRDNDFIEQIKNQIDVIDSRSILFLPKISEIELVIDGEKRTIRKTTKGYNCVVDETTNDETKTDKYYVVKKDIKNVDTGDIDDDEQKIIKDIHIIIARKIEDEENNDEQLDQRYDYIYNAFATKMTMPTGWIVNANFSMSADRNSINEKIFNWKAMKGIVDLMFEEAEKMSKKKCDFEAIKTLVGNYDKFQFTFSDEDIEDYYIEKLKQAKILPGVNGNYLSLNDKPYFYQNEMMDYLDGDGFENTVKYCDYREIDEIMQEYISSDDEDYHRMSPAEISKLINSRLDFMDISEQIKLSELFWKEYGNDADVKPNFFVDNYNRRIDFDSEKYTETENSVAKSVPGFLNIKFVRKDFIDEIHRQLKTSAKDFESLDYAKYYDIKQYRLLNIAKSCKRAVEGDPKRAKDYIYWLYKNDILPEKIIVEELNTVVLPAKNGGSLDIQESFFYDGIFEELFPDSEYIIEPFADNSEKFIDFLSEIGVKEFPDNFERDFSSNVFGEILRNHPFEQVIRLLNSVTWLHYNSLALDIINGANWIKINDKKYCPRNVILNKEYGAKFTDIIGIDKNDIKDIVKLDSSIFEKLEFRDKITEMNTSEIYSILLELPKKDKHGKMAKKIYRMLSDSREFDADDIDTSDDNYNEFIKNGLVPCKDGKYYPNDEALYFAEGILPSAAIRGKNLIEVDKKRGASKVKKLFGVEKLSVDFYIHEADIHPFQNIFLEELKKMKIGIFATDKMELTSEAKRDIKSLKINLSHSATVIINNEVKKLEDYEFASRKNSPGEYYIKISDGRNFDSIRYNPKFTSALTEMFVMRIGTEAAETNSDSIARMIETRDIKGIIGVQENGDERYKEASEFMGEIIERGEPDDEEMINKNLVAVENALIKLEDKYCQNLYLKLKNSPIEEQEKFEALREDFVNFDPDEDILLSDDFDAETFVINHFDINTDIENDGGQSNWEDINKEIGEELNYNQALKSLARFGRREEIKKKIEDKKARDKELEPWADNEIPDVEVVKRKPVARRTRTSRISRGGFGGGRKSGGNADEIGKRGQQIVMKYLEKNGYQDVEDRSGYAIKDSSNVNASDSYGYDIVAKDENGVMHYIEVKSHGGRVKHNEFELSKNEFEKAIQISSQENWIFEIYLVDGVDKNKCDKPEIQVKEFMEIRDKLIPEEPRKYYYFE